MAYFVHGRDVPGLADDSDEPTALDEAHWSYMDRWSDRLIARGPTLSADGSMHTGSVHIVDLPDAAEAERFAFEEPYYLAGLYEEVTVARFAPLIEGTMWDRPAPSPERPATLVLAEWTVTAFERDVADRARAAFADDDTWVFAGALLSADSSTLHGLAAAADRAAADIDDLVGETLSHVSGRPVDVELQRWRRGGRPAS